MAEPAQREEDRAVGPLRQRAGRQRRHGLFAAEPGQRRDGDEVVAPRAQAVDDARQRGHRLRAFAAGVVQQHHLAGTLRVAGGDLGQHVVDDLVHAGPLPVFGVDVQADRDVAHPLRDPDRHQLVGGGRFGVAEVGRAEQPHRAPGKRLEQALGGVEFQRHDAGRAVAEVRVGEGVVADVVALGDFALHQPRRHLGVRADDEERGRHVLGLEDVEDLRRPLRIGAVIEGQRDLVRQRAGALDHVRSGQAGVALVVDAAVVLVHIDGTCARCGLRSDLEHFALAFDVDVLALADRAQLVRRRCPVVAAQHRPDRRVLRTKSPQRIAVGFVVVGGMDLVVRGDAVEEPHLMRNAVVVAVGEAWVLRIRIERDPRLGVRGEIHRVLEGERIGAAPTRPVVAVVADRHDGLVRIERLHALVQVAFEPVLAGDAARVLARPVFVVGHQQFEVDDVGVALVVPCGIVEGHRQHDAPAVRIERIVEFVEEGLEVLLRAVGDFLEVHRHALEVVGGDECDDLRDARLAHRRIRQHACQTLAVPVAVHGVLQQRQDRGGGFLRADQVQRLGIDAGMQRHVRAAHAHPAGDHPVQRGQRTLQRGIAAVIPVDVEADRQCPVGRLVQRWRRWRARHAALAGADARRMQQLLPGTYFRRQPGGGFEQFGIGRLDPGQCMPGLAMPAQVQPDHARPDEQADRAGHHEQRADHAGQQRQSRDMAGPSAGGVEEDRFLLHA